MTEKPPLCHSEPVGLKRKIGLTSAIGFIVGTTIGSGVFISSGGVLRETNSIGLCLTIWLACGILSIFGAMSYIELGTVVPASGGEYSYLRESFGDIPAFLYSWVCTTILIPASIAILGLAFAKYSIRPFLSGSTNVHASCNEYEWLEKFACASVIALVAFVNSVSVNWATKLQNILAIVKLIAVGLIVGAGIYNISQGKTQNLKTGFDLSNWSFGAIGRSFYGALWAYNGWNTLNYITEEVVNPHVTLPLGLLIGVPIITLCYILLNVSYFTIMTPAEIMDPNTVVGVEFADRMFGSFSFIIPLCIVLSIIGTLNGCQFSCGRVSLVASRHGHMVKILSYVDKKRNTPSPAIIYNSLVAIVLGVFLDIEGLIGFFSFTAWIFYSSAAAGVIKLRYSKPNASRPFKVPLIIPAIVVLASVGLVIGPIIDDPKIEYIYSCGFILSGLIAYWLFVYCKLALPGLKKLTDFLQVLMQVGPPENEDVAHDSCK